MVLPKVRCGKVWGGSSNIKSPTSQVEGTSLLNEQNMVLKYITSMTIMVCMTFPITQIIKRVINMIFILLLWKFRGSNNVSGGG